MKKLVVKLLRYLPTTLQALIYRALWRCRSFLYRLQRIHPARLVRLLSGSSKCLGCPLGVVEHSGELIIEKPVVEALVFAKSEQVSFLLSKSREYQFRDVYRYDLTGARVYGAQGAVIDSTDKVVADVSFEIGRSMGGKSTWSHSIFTKFSLGELHEIEGKAGLICAPSSNTYFHWLFDVLPRIHFYKDLDLDYYLVGQYNARYQKETIQLLGGKPVRQIGVEQVQTESLCCLSSINRDGFMAETVQFLRLSFLSDRKEQNKRRIFISRSSADYRKLLNYESIKKVLDDWGIEVFRAEEHCFTEQVKAFQEADLVVAPHGSGLSNIVFCDPGTKVLELFSEEYTNPLFCRLAQRCGLSYDCIIDGTLYKEKAESENIIADILVTAEALELSLKHWLGEPDKTDAFCK